MKTCFIFFLNFIFQPIFGSLSDEKLIVYPLIIEENGHPILKDLNEFQPSSSKIKIAFDFDATQVVLDLERNEKLFNKNKPLIVQRFKKNQTIQSELLSFENRSCHFKGRIVNQTDSFASVSLCNRMVTRHFFSPLFSTIFKCCFFIQKGFIVFNSAIYLIEPAKMPNLSAHLLKRTEKTIESSDNSSNKRKRRWSIKEKYVETLIVADKTMAQRFESDNLEVYLLTVMNMVHHFRLICFP